MGSGIRTTTEAGGHTVHEILDSLIEGVVVFDHGLRLEYANQNARFMFQLSCEDCFGRSIDEVFPPEIARALAAPLRAALEGEFIHAHELVSRFPEGTELTLGIAVSELPSAPGEPSSLVITARDLSVSREVERLQEIARAKEEFFSTVSHELRTPLTSIIAYAEMLFSGYSGTENDQREFLGIIKSEGERLNRLIDEVLDLSRMEANRLALHLEEVDLRDCIGSCVRGVEGMALQSGLSLEFTPGETPAIATADAERLRQVVVNLLGNAIKFTPAGGRITAGTRTTDRSIESWVSDTGIGIPEEDLERVFAKFERVDRPGAMVKGTGLGLPISRGLVERMGGRIWAESKPGEGTTIRFTLPRAR